MAAAAAPVIDTSDMDPELARYLNRNYWQQKSVELKSSLSAAMATQPSAPAIAADTKVSTAGGGSGLNSASTLAQQGTGREDDMVRISQFTFFEGLVLASICRNYNFGNSVFKGGRKPYILGGFVTSSALQATSPL